MVTHSLHRLFSVHAASVLERQLRLRVTEIGMTLGNPWKKPRAS